MLDGGHRFAGHLEAHGRHGVDSHPEATWVGTDLIGERSLLAGRTPPGIGVGIADDFENGGGVGHGASDHALGRQTRPVGNGVGHPTAAGLQPDQSATGCRDPDGAPSIAGMRY